MDYNFESLGDERFQEFCGALISKEFENSTMFPIGQPDGGRDSLAYYMDSPQKQFKVFQVKYVRNPLRDVDLHRWLTETIEMEVEKISKLIPKGATAYYLITNIKGTGHLDVGSKDKVNAILEKHIAIPAICWWREDICTLFEKDPLFKWSFPQVVNGQDILNSFLFEHFNDNKQTRESVIKAYLADQYRMDSDVKFRQIDLQNKLLDLFTDVPIRIKKYNEKNRGLKRLLTELAENEFLTLDSQNRGSVKAEPSTRAANFLLSPKAQNEIQRILLEGGPGQGKSTVSQYICQVHRARLLNKQLDMNGIPDSIKNSPVRLPFKVDLRHIAMWVENKNPYQESITDENYNKVWQKSLEAFLIAHIYYHSQIEITAGDLIAIVKASSVIFVFDGFDEIASQDVRKEVIEFINRGVSRIQENSKSLQVIITSRPSVFSDTVGFSVDLYPHFELTDITGPVTQEYVEKWIKANKLDSKEGAQIKKLVDEKLQMSHLRDLAKTPMQLAIFISLLRTKGESLPNKRTALYDSYIELFFDRESEKNSTIRDQRDLIIDIHQYLAWILHSEAELYKHSGSIHIDDLKARLRSYLSREGHDPTIADKLFQVVKDRVCALASRVQGTFEFEVQPLREYFCAKFLYETSQYSPPGKERSGTLPDRFEGIAKNFYWQNVARFFAGCFSKGELSMLIQKLRELQEDSVLRYTNYPRVITSQLLSDFVFTQYPVHLRDVVKIIIDGLNIGNIINQTDDRTSIDPIRLPYECGRNEIVTECFKQLQNFPSNDYALELIGVVKNNPDRVVERWCDIARGIASVKLPMWLEYAYNLEIIHRIPADNLKEVIKNATEEYSIRICQILIDGNRLELLLKEQNRKAQLVINILDQRTYVLNRQYAGQSLFTLSLIVNASSFRSIYTNGTSNMSTQHFIEHRFSRPQNKESVQIFRPAIGDHLDAQISKLVGSLEHVLQLPVSSWSKNLDNWEVLIEELRSSFGDRWGIKVISIISGGIKSEKNSDIYDNLNDNTISLVRRVRNARMKSGVPKYWKELLESSSDVKFILLALLTWGTPKTLLELQDELENAICGLSEEEYVILRRSLSDLIQINPFTKVQQRIIVDSYKQTSPKDVVKFLVSQRFPPDVRLSFIHDQIKEYNGVLESVGTIKLSYLIQKFLRSANNLDMLADIKEVYVNLHFDQSRVDHFAYYLRHYRNNHPVTLPYEIAKHIMDDCKNFPTYLVSLAEYACRVHASKVLIPVGKIAVDEQWFVGETSSY
jgi:hypothetical protein